MRDSATRRRLRTPETYTPFDAADCNQPIHRRFEQQAAQHPTACAIRLPSGDVSYARLNEAANRAARALLAMPAMAERPVALLMPQGYQSIVWTLAILKAGLGYAPLDQRLPAPVLRDMLDDLGPAALLVASRHLDLGREVGASRCPVVDIDAVVGVEALSADNLDLPVSAEDVAYVFYTSGSTGRSKGVADSHRNVLHNVLRYTNTLRFAPGDRLSLVQNPSFSGTVSSLFGALLNGAAVVPFDLLGDGLALLSEAVRKAQVTVFHAVPSIFRELSDRIDRFPSVRLVRLEGDRVQARDIRHFQSNFQDDCTLVNGLGATECGLVRQFFVDHKTSTDSAGVVPVGYPVPDVTVTIVDEEGRTLAADSPGEIVVESRFLALGYWRNPALTAERFEALAEGVRRYRTGDLRAAAGRRLPRPSRPRRPPDSNRRRVRRYRRDRAIAAVGPRHRAGGGSRLRRSDERATALRLPRPRTGRRQPSRSVDGYGGARARGAGRTHRAARRADTVHVPGRTAAHEGPEGRSLTAARAGPRHGPSCRTTTYAPATVLERQMAEAWSEVLEIDPVGVTDSLFDLGGDSLHAARIVSRLTPICGDVLRITSLFEHPTIRALAGELAHDRTMSQPAPVAAGGGPTTASPSSAWRAGSRAPTRSTSSGATFGRDTRASPSSVPMNSTSTAPRPAGRGWSSPVDCSTRWSVSTRVSSG